MIKYKVMRARVKDIDHGTHMVEAVVSDESDDRDGDVIRQAGWILENFNKHPILVSSHEYDSLRNQIGKWHEMRVVRNTLQGTAEYFVGKGNPEADWGWELASQGEAAYSVGFQPLEYKEREDVDGESRGWWGGPWEFLKHELLEVSHVVIPANANALQMDFKSLKSAWREQQKGAIAPHSTPMADRESEWDASSQVGQVEGRAQLRRMHAWVDSGGDPDAKSSYKLPHHNTDGKVVWRGVSAAAARLNQTDMPSGDVAGVRRHLAGHYRQFDETPPWEGQEAANLSTVTQVTCAYQGCSVVEGEGHGTLVLCPSHLKEIRKYLTPATEPDFVALASILRNMRTIPLL